MLVDLDNKHISKCKNMLSKMEYLKFSHSGFALFQPAELKCVYKCFQ